MAENLQIRLADPGEADRLAEIEAICFHLRRQQVMRKL